MLGASPVLAVTERRNSVAPVIGRTASFLGGGQGVGARRRTLQKGFAPISADRRGSLWGVTRSGLFFPAAMMATVRRSPLSTQCPLFGT